VAHSTYPLPSCGSLYLPSTFTWLTLPTLCPHVAHSTYPPPSCGSLYLPSRLHAAHSTYPPPSCGSIYLPSAFTWLTLPTLHPHVAPFHPPSLPLSLPPSHRPSLPPSLPPLPFLFFPSHPNLPTLPSSFFPSLPAVGGAGSSSEHLGFPKSQLHKRRPHLLALSQEGRGCCETL